MLPALALWTALQKNPPPAVTLTLIPEKKSFQKGEPVAFEIVLVNRTKNKLIVDRRFLPGADETFGQELTILLTGPKEMPLPNLVMAQPSPLTKSDLQMLLPNQSISQKLPLSNIFLFSTAGDYQIQAIYNTTGLASALPYWHGRVVSPPVSFSIASNSNSPKEK